MTKIVYFLEDLAQETFVRALVERIAVETGVEGSVLEHVVRNATGGYGRVVSEFGRFLTTAMLPDLGRESDLLMPVIDADCEGASKRRRRLQHLVESAGYSGPTIFTVPDPHTERWHMADPVALQLVARSPGLSALPPVRCQRDLYKSLLLGEFQKGGLSPVLGGAEYAADIVSLMDLYRAGQNDRSLATFVEELRDFFRH